MGLNEQPSQGIHSRIWGQGANTKSLRGLTQGDGSEKFRHGQLLTIRPASPESLAAGAGSAEFCYTPAFSYQLDYLQYQAQMMYSIPQQP